MPYEGQLASKATQSNIINNPDVQDFLSHCNYLTPPSDKEAGTIASYFREAPEVDGKLPEFVISVDGSNYESSIDDKLPSTKIGYISIGALLFPLADFDSLKVGNFVDPFKVASLKDQNTTLIFSLPSANIRWGDADNVRDGFRAALDDYFKKPNTWTEQGNFHSSLRSTLFKLASLRPGEMGTGDPFKLKIYKCPNCSQRNIELEDTEEAQFCPNCDCELYPTDCLRLWEEVNDYQSNQVVLSRLMLILEHLIPIHYIRYLNEKALLHLARMAFFIDGQLAVFGNAAWLHRAIMIYLHRINQKLKRKNQDPLMMIALQKTGQIVDHVTLIDRFLPPNRLFAIEDEYRYKYIIASRNPSSHGFGYETYYGQDFIFKTESNRTFVFSLPYPFETKDLSGRSFPREKVKWDHYPQLPRALQLINHLESDLYKNAVVPIALAHRYTAISLQPGGQILDILTRQGLNG